MSGWISFANPDKATSLFPGPGQTEVTVFIEDPGAYPEAKN